MRRRCGFPPARRCSCWSLRPGFARSPRGRFSIISPRVGRSSPWRRATRRRESSSRPARECARAPERPEGVAEGLLRAFSLWQAGRLEEEFPCSGNELYRSEAHFSRVFGEIVLPEVLKRAAAAERRYRRAWGVSPREPVAGQFPSPGRGDICAIHGGAVVSPLRGSRALSRSRSWGLRPRLFYAAAMRLRHREIPPLSPFDRVES